MNLNGPATDSRGLCRTCGQQHITHQRPLELGFVCDYRLPTEHYHETEEERDVLCGDGSYSAETYLRAAESAQARQGTRGKHPRKARQRAADKPTSAAA